MNLTVVTYLTYLIISISMTIWVARTLHRNGRVFLLDCFDRNEELTESVNHLLVVGFYLVNIGFVTMFLRLDLGVESLRGVFEALSHKVGTVLLVLGGMHFFNILVFHKIRKRGMLHSATPPVIPSLGETATNKF